MALTPTRSYGKTIAKGNAHVHQGDQHFSKNYRLGCVNNLQIFIDSAPDSSPTATDRALTGQLLYDGHFCQNKPILTSDQTNIESSLAFGSRNSRMTTVSPTHRHTRHHGTGFQIDSNARGAAVVNSILEGIGAPEEAICLPFSDEVEQHIFRNDDLNEVHSALAGSNPKIRSFVIGAVDKIRRNCWFPVLVSLLPVPTPLQCEEATQKLTRIVDTANGLTNIPTSGHVLQDLIATCCALMIVLIYSSSSSTPAVTSTAIRPIQKLPLLAGIIAFAASRYFGFPLLGQALSELSGDYIVIEDPFRVNRRVPMSHCEHFKLLEAFLSVNLAGTTAEAFINAKQFNLSLGKRGGFAISEDQWSEKGVIKPGSKVVMSIYVRRTRPKCVECQADLTMSSDEHYSCHPCGRYYGNCAALKFWTRPAEHVPTTRAAKKAQLVTESIRSPSPTTPSRLGELKTEDLFDVTDLRNIDFQIFRAEGARRARPQTRRKDIFCRFCIDRPRSFYDLEELALHIRQHHSQPRPLWICRDPSNTGTFLANCEACRNRKTYSSQNKAAAHLRRVHLKRGGREPSMEFLKAWLWETWGI